jgi:hypothetical protein
VERSRLHLATLGDNVLGITEPSGKGPVFANVASRPVKLPMKLAEPGPASACLRGRSGSPFKQVSCDKWFARKLTYRAASGTRRLTYAATRKLAYCTMRELGH